MSTVRAQIEQLRTIITAQEAELADLEVEVLDIQRELSDFSQHYERIVQPVVDRLQVIRELIAELEQQYTLPNASSEAPHSTFESPAWTPPPGYVSVEEQFRRTWRVPRQEDFSPSAARTVPAVEDAPELLKRLYRQLARRYHPDLSADPAEREHRNRLMAEINNAYNRRDLDALKVLAAQPENRSVDEPLETLQLRQMQQIHLQLTQRLVHLKRERDDLLSSDLMWLKIQQSLNQGRDVLREVADRLEQEYALCVDRLAQLRR